MPEPRILPLIVHDMELWTRPAPPIAQPATPTPTPSADSAPPAIALPSVIAERRAHCAACEHIATPEQCGCTDGLCRHPQARNPNLTALAAAECPLGRWHAIAT